MLRNGTLVMGGFDLKSHLLQRQADLTAAALPQIGRAHIKIARGVVRNRGGVAVLVGVEKEKLTLRAYIEGISHICRFLQGFAQDVTRISLKRLTVLFVNIADQARNFAMLRMPRKQAEGVQIRL